MAALVYFLLVSCATDALMYDVLDPFKVPGLRCQNGCADWSSANATVNAWWSEGKPPADAGRQCAQLANAPGLQMPMPVLDPKGVGSVGSWCLCNNSSEWDYCVSAQFIPEQINIQISSPDSVVLSFVTFEPGQNVDLMPEGRLGTSATDLRPIETDVAVTHVYKTPSGNRTYFMHFIVLRNLSPRTRYFYQVKSGARQGTWSDVFSFRAGYATGETRVAIFGDMGVYSWNNMNNMKKNIDDEDIDLVVHMGDHCYNIGGMDDRRGDGYMQAYQNVIANVPWLPIVGNHEFYDGEKLRRYLNQTEGSVLANPASHPFVKGARSTADSALGALLSRGNHHGAGSHGTVPSGTSRFYSVDFGLVHFVALDLNMYNAVDTCGEACREAQLKWLEQDLAKANSNREAVPWIVAMSHFPLYCSNCPHPGNDPPGDWWNSEACEFAGHDQSCLVTDAKGAASKAAGSSSPNHDDMVPDFEPLFMKYGVDVYSSGHIHDYEFIYPVYNNTAVQKNFVNPKAPVHLVTGNGGPPSPSQFGIIEDWSYVHSNTYSYTRLIAYNSTTMKWIQVANEDSSILTELVVTQEHHGPFPIPAQ